LVEQFKLNMIRRTKKMWDEWWFSGWIVIKKMVYIHEPTRQPWVVRDGLIGHSNVPDGFMLFPHNPLMADC